MSPRPCPCGRTTDGKRPVCCTMCEDGKHTVACAIRQVSAGNGRSVRMVRTERLEVRGEVV